MPIPTAIIVDDHKSVVEALCIYFKARKVCNIIGQAGTVAEGKRMCKDLAPSLAIVDLMLSDGSGVGLLQYINENCPNMHALVYTGCVKEATVLEALECDPHGFVLKGSDLETLATAIHTICKEQRVFFCPSSTKMRSKLGRDKIVPILSPREKEVLGLVAAGLSSKLIAAQLKLSQRTVDACRKRLMLKFRVQDVASLIREAISLGLVPEKRRLKPTDLH